MPGRTSDVSFLLVASSTRTRRRPRAHSGNRLTSRRAAKSLSREGPQTRQLARNGRWGSATQQDPNGVEEAEGEVEPGRALDHGAAALRRRGHPDVAPEPEGRGGAQEDEGALQGDHT